MFNVFAAIFIFGSQGLLFGGRFMVEGWRFSLETSMIFNFLIFSF